MTKGSKIFQRKFKVCRNRQKARGFFHLALEAKEIAGVAFPGQFVNIRVSESREPLLRRPFGIHRIKGQVVEILYEVKGKGTEILSRKKPGEYLDVIGPLGNGFSILDTRYSMLVAGGMGVAPLLFLAETTRIQYPASRIQILIGAKTKSQILCEKEFKDLGCEVKIATDNGSSGFKGYVSDLLKMILHKGATDAIDSIDATTIYACGPQPMLKQVALLAEKYHIPTQVSLEEHMACGVGACFGCVVETKKGNQRVCKEGPVFNANEIIW